MHEMRLFVAVPLEEEIKRKLIGFQTQLKQKLSGIRWASPNTFHLTLKFIGEVEVNIVKPICEKVEEIVKDFEPLTLTIKSLGKFGSGNRTRVLWAGFEGDIHSVVELVNELNSGLEVFGIVLENKAYHPHITLGRAKNQVDNIAVEELINKYSSYEFGELEVNRVIVFQSELKPEGAQHHPIKTIDLL